MQHPASSCVTYLIPRAGLEIHAEPCFNIADKALNLIQHERNSMFSPKEVYSAVGIWQSQSLLNVSV